MKKWIAFTLSAVLLAGIIGCAGFAAGAPTPPPPAQPVALVAVATTPKVSGTLKITLTDCDNVEIREVSGGTLGFSGGADKFHTNLAKPSGGTTAMTVKQLRTQTGKTDRDWGDHRPVLTVPRGIYASVVINLGDSGAAIHPAAANYRITAEDSACSVRIPQGYAGKLDYKADESACTLEFAGQMRDATLKLITRDSAISLPKDWALDSKKTLTRGTGAAKLNINFTDCVASVKEGLTGLDGEYAATSASIAMADRNTGEIVLGSKMNSVIISSDLDQTIKTLKAATQPNTVSDPKSIPATGISTLQLNSRFCGVAVEPSKSGQFEIATVGAADPKRFTVTSNVQGGVLTITASCKIDALCYINTSPENRVNTVRIGVPAGVLKGIRLDCGASNILLSNLDLPVEGMAGSGLVRVVSKGTITQPIRMESSNGGLFVSAKSVTGDVTLSTENGSAALKANSVTGKATLSAENGSVDVQVEQLKNAELTAENGSVDATVGTVGERVRAGVENGSLAFTLTRTPKDLTFHVKSDWYDDWDDYADWKKNTQNGGQNADWKNPKPGSDFYASHLPAGWYDGYAVGTGKPVLELSAVNGDFSFNLGAAKK